MQIVLLKDIKTLGQTGETKNVAIGYARNYLIPQGLAVLANSGEAVRLKSKLKSLELKENKKENSQKKITTKYKDLNLEFKVKISDSGTLFSGISKKVLAQKLNEKYNLDIKEKDIDLKQDIKTVGQSEVIIKLAGQNTKVNVNILGEND